MTGVIFSPVPCGHYDVLRHVLDAALLPTDDVMGPHRSFFSLSDHEGLIGYVGLEGFGPDLLLRSLVVLPTRKLQGHGTTLLTHVEAVAGQAGAERLHLLTTSASGFFRARGFGLAQRDHAPASISGTQQFAKLCPASATYLVKELA